jgi:MoxR-like ATPase
MAKRRDSATPPIASSDTTQVSESLEDQVRPGEPDEIILAGKSNEAIEADIEAFVHTAQQLEKELCSIVVGQERVIRELLLTLLAGGHALLEGVPGLGKTLLVRTLADALALKFARIQFTPDLMPADIVGTTIVSEEADGASGSTGIRRVFRFQPGPIFANIVLADEVNRATPKTQSALLEGMQERTVSVGETSHALPRPFFVMATQNPLEMEGTYALPEAQLDRFLLKILVRFPNASDLLRIIDTTAGTQTLTAAQVATGEQLQRMIETARAVPVASHIKEYAVQVLLATHPDQQDAPEAVRQYVRYGASPRGLQALILTAKVLALLEGRYNVSLEDIQAVAYPALRHRLILNFDGLADGITTDELIQIVLEESM